MVALTKEEIRRAHTTARKNLSAADKEAKDALLTDAILTLAEGKKISAYRPLSSEPGGKDFVEKLHSADEEVWLPLSGTEGQLTWSLYQGPESAMKRLPYRSNFAISVQPPNASYSLLRYSIATLSSRNFGDE